MGNLRRCRGTCLLADNVSVLGMMSSWISFDIFQGLKEIMLSICYRLKHKYHLPLKCKNKLPDCCHVDSLPSHVLIYMILSGIQACPFSVFSRKPSTLRPFSPIQRWIMYILRVIWYLLKHVLHLPIVCILFRIHPYIFEKKKGLQSLTLQAFIDSCFQIKPKVGTVCFGVAASQGALLLAGGEKGMRYAMPNARIMIHQPQSGCGVWIAFWLSLLHYMKADVYEKIRSED